MAIGRTNSASGGIQPTGKKSITTTQEVDVTDYATAQVEDANLAAGNIKLGINILGPKLKETVTEKFGEHSYFLAGGHPSTGVCSLGIQVKGDTESNLIFPA